MAENKLPNVVVLIAHHNYQQYLADAVQSAVSQTYPNIHVCIVDSSDSFEKTMEVLDGGENKFATVFSSNDENLEDGFVDKILSYDNISVIRLKGKPRGPSHNRNIGIAYSIDSADIYVILDADDIMLPNKVSAVVEKFLENPQEIGVVYADTIVWNVVTGKQTREYREPYSLARLDVECIVHSGAAISKLALQDVVEETGWYDNTMRTCEDFDLWSRIGEKYMIVHVPKALTIVRVQPQNSSITVPTETWQKNWQRVQEKKSGRKK